jgi:RimJ/RimL family protein N-acetyltransferase
LERFDISKNYQWGNDWELISLTGMAPYPKSTVDIERWYDSNLNNTTAKLFSVKTHEGEYIGNIELSAIDWRVGKCELGLILGEKNAWNQGYGTEAVNAAVDFAFKEMRLHRVSAKVLAYNPRAQRCFEKCGFVREGVERQGFYLQGEFHDVVMFGRLKTDVKTT